MKAKDMPCVTVEQVLRLRDHASSVEHQRNQLREALSELDEALRQAWSDGRLPHDVVCPYLAQKTSAALKATEEG